MIGYGLARLGRDAELRSTGQGEQVASLSLAFTFGSKDGNGKRPTQWVEASLWGKRAEALVEYLTRGTQVCVSLENLHIQTFKRQDGTEGHKMVGKVASIDLAASGTPTPAAPAPASRPAARPTAAPGRPASGFEDMDDDIPF